MRPREHRVPATALAAACHFVPPAHPVVSHELHAPVMPAWLPADRPPLPPACLHPRANRYLLLMSDGIFEFMESCEVVDFVHQQASAGLQPHQVAQRLVREARRR